MGAKKVEKFNMDDIVPRASRTESAAMPIDIANGVKWKTDYADIPCEKLCAYKNKDPSDIVDKTDPEYQALVISIIQNGVYDAIIVRPIDDDRFEILAGHHRTEASKDAQRQTVPAKIIRDCDDKSAEDIYRVTNLLRKKQTVRDLAYGWWHYFQVTRHKGKDIIDDLIEQGVISESFRTIKESKGNKQLYRYARLHELTDEMIDLVEKKAMSIKFAEQISFIDKALQNDLLNYKANLKSLEKAKKLRELAEGKMEGEKWSTDSIQKILFPNPLPSEGKSGYNNDGGFITALRQYIPKQYHEEEQMLELIQEALTLYFNQNPDKQ